MQDAPTTQRDQHQHTSSNNAFIAPNATSNHFLGRQQKSWALPRQSSFGSDQYQSPETVDSQAQQLNRGVGEAVEGRSSQDGGLEALRAIQAALASRKNGPVRRDTASGQAPSTLRLDSAGQTTRDVVRSVDDGRPRSSYIDSGPAGIDSAPVGISGQLQAAMASPSQPSKRPRLDAQVQQGSFQALETQTASSHSFVASPTSPISILAYSHLAPSSISSPQVDSGAGGYRQGHMPDSPQRPPAPTQLPTPTIPQRPLSARVPTQTTPRRESSSMPSPSVVTPTNVGQAAISAEAQLHPNARPRRTPSVPNVPLQSGPQSSMGRLSTLAQLPRLDSVMSDPRTRDSFKDWAQQRVSLLKEACNSEDWFYLTLHQIYCWRSLNGAAMAPLDITGTRDSALAALEVILIPNIKLQHKALQWFSQFPVDPRDLFRASGPQSFNILQQLHTFLDRMATEWPEMHASCLTRNYPPSPNELYARLAMPSTVLQVTFFTYVFRQIEGIISSSWVSQAIQFFKFTQSQLIDKMKRVSLGLPEEPPKLEYGLAQYASEYFALRHKHTSGPMRSTSDDRSALNMADTLSIPAPGPSPQSTPAVSDSTSQDTNRVSRAPQNVARPGAANLPAPGIFSGLNTGGQNGGLRRSAPQPPPVPPNNPQNTQRIGPRQQEFVQDITGATIQPSTTVVTANGLSPAVSHPSGHPPLVNSFSEPGSWPQTAPGVQNRAAAGQSPLSRASQTRTVRPATTNGGPRMQQHNTVPQVKTSLLPPTGRLMTRNIHPNSDVLALHQARLLSPEPRIITTADEPQPIGRLFQVMQRFILSPQLITMEQSYYEWQIGIPAADMSRKANDVPILATRPSSKLYREFKRGSIIYRLRCVAMPDLTQSAPSESQWSTAATNWPNYCFVSLADSEIPIRRKSHFGRDLPCDLMPGIRTGLNTIEMSVHYGPEELSHVFAVAVEQIGTFSAEQCTQQITLISQDVALAAIVASLQQPQTENDDDITIVDSHLSIDLIDPFTAQVCRIPVRGRSCTHRECFDLQAFLESRPNKVKGVPLSSSDEWRCPICSRDARPQSLLLDGFLHAVVRKVREDARGQAEDADEVRAILVTADGQWWPKKAERHQQPRRDSKSADGTGMGNGGINVPYAEDCKDAVMRDATTDRPVVMELD